MKKATRLFVLMAILLVLFALQVGVAFAHPGPGLDNGPCAPVGRNISDQGFANGFENPNSNAVTGITNNPLCPLHGECTP